jgi:heme-degrading monooxygenase HmoA
MRFVAEQVVPASRQTPGWKGVLGLASPDGRRGLTLTFWDSLETLVASARDASSFRGAASAAGVDVASSDRLEVVLDERPE